MKNATRFTAILAGVILIAGTFMPTNLPTLWLREDWKIGSGLFATSLILAQWALTLGRMVFQTTGTRWQRWVNVHKWLGLFLPLALLAHALTLGYGLLAILPLTLLGATWLGAGLGASPNPKSLRMHIILSAMTLAMMFVHIYVTTFYN